MMELRRLLLRYLPESPRPRLGAGGGGAGSRKKLNNDNDLNKK